VGRAHYSDVTGTSIAGSLPDVEFRQLDCRILILWRWSLSGVSSSRHSPARKQPWPIVVRARQGDRVPLVSVLFAGAKDSGYDVFVTVIVSPVAE
jgi:hypothetical protein